MTTNRDDVVQQWRQTIPRKIWREVGHARVLEAGFGAGPGCVAGLTETFTEPASVEDGLVWLSRYAGSLKIAHLQLEDLSVLFFEPLGFRRWDRTLRAPPRAGVIVTHPVCDGDDDRREP